MAARRFFSFMIVFLGVFLFLKSSSLMLRGHYFLEPETVKANQQIKRINTNNVVIPNQKIAFNNSENESNSLGRRLLEGGSSNSSNVVSTESNLSNSDIDPRIDITGSVGDGSSNDDVETINGVPVTDEDVLYTASEKKKGGLSDNINVLFGASADVSDERPVDYVPKEAPTVDELLIERITEKQEELERLKQELEAKDALLKAREVDLEEKLSKLESFEQQAQEEDKESPKSSSFRMNHLVTMYDKMKPKSAAEIFNQLSPDVMLEIAIRLKPKKLADIMAKMNKDVAQQLTSMLIAEDLASNQRSPQDKNVNIESLPKIEAIN